MAVDERATGRKQRAGRNTHFMVGSGIPPSVDRQDRLKGQLVLGLVLLALFLGLMYFVLGASDQFSREVGVSGTDSESRLEAYLLEKERASAYEALRDHLDQRSQEPGIVAVFCRDSSHRWVSDRIEFTGDVDFEGLDGRLRPQKYVALMSGSSQDGWTIEAVRVRPVVRP